LGNRIGVIIMINEIEKIYDADNNHFGYEMRLTDGKILNVPLDEANTDYQAIQEWIADGGTVIDNGGGE